MARPMYFQLSFSFFRANKSYLQAQQIFNPEIKNAGETYLRNNFFATENSKAK